jgi:hypothetical protein
MSEVCMAAAGLALGAVMGDGFPGYPEGDIGHVWGKSQTSMLTLLPGEPRTWRIMRGTVACRPDGS